MLNVQARLKVVVCAAAIVLPGASTVVAAGNSQGTPATTLKSSSGGTALSRGGGTGGTGVPTTANAPLDSLRSTFKPAHATAPPPAGVRPHTDLAAQRKLTDLSSRRITKQSSLYNKIVLGPRDPNLVKPYAEKMGPKDGGGGSFKQTPAFSAAESKGNVIVTSGGTDNNSREAASLSSHAVAATATANQFEAEEVPRRTGYGVLDWLAVLFAAVATGGVGLWLWQEAPKAARMSLPATAPGKIGKHRVAGLNLLTAG